MLETALYWYTLVLFCVMAISIVGKVGLKVAGKYDVTPKSVQLEELVTIPFIMFGFVAAYGYLYSEPLVSDMFWQVYVVLFFGQQLISFWMPKQRWMKREISSRNYLMANALGVLSSIPLYYMLAVYAFVSFPQRVGV